MLNKHQSTWTTGLGVWWVKPIIRYRLFHEKLHLMELEHRLTKYPKVGGIQGSRTPLTPDPPNPPLINEIDFVMSVLLEYYP